MNRRRNDLHNTKVTEFIVWALAQGYEAHECKSFYEVFRLVNPNRGEILIGHKRDGTDHITTTGRLTQLVTRWQKEKQTSPALPVVLQS